MSCVGVYAWSEQACICVYAVYESVCVCVLARLSLSLFKGNKCNLTNAVVWNPVREWESEKRQSERWKASKTTGMTMSLSHPPT